MQDQDEETFSGGEKASFYPKMGWNGPLDHPIRGSQEFLSFEYCPVANTKPLYTFLVSDVAL